MNSPTFRVTCRAITVSFWSLCLTSGALAADFVRVETGFGSFFIEMRADAAPLTVQNFLNYVDDGDYDGVFVHRSEPGFIIQTGGFTLDDLLQPVDVPSDPPVLNEFQLSNVRGTVAMAKLGGDPDSATNQWFINIANNIIDLDTQNEGFTVFGEVDADGMAIADSIAALPRFNFGRAPFRAVPLTDFFVGDLVRENFVLIETIQSFEGIPGLPAAVLPSGRTVSVGNTATAFATIINTAAETAASCRLQPITPIPAVFGFQTTDPSTNQLTGQPNQAVDVAGGAAQTFVFSLTPAAAFGETTVEIDFACGNAEDSVSLVGVNTFTLSATTTPTADIVALAATLSGDGIVDIPGVGGSGVFAVATVNVGVAETITVTADIGSATLPIDVFVCQTDSATGACLADPGLSVNTPLAANETATFGFFVPADGEVPFDPAVNRVFARFSSMGASRGSTSVAVRTVN